MKYFDLGDYVMVKSEKKGGLVVVINRGKFMFCMLFVVGKVIFIFENILYRKIFVFSKLVEVYD